MATRHFLIIDDVVRAVFADAPDLHPDLTVVASDDPAIAEGWSYDAAAGTFSAPPRLEPPPVTVPASVSSAQAKIQLRRAGLREKVDAAVQAAGGEVSDWFTDARAWDRQNPYVLQLGAGLKLKPADIDALFIAAAQISA